MTAQDPWVLMEDDEPDACIHLYHTPCNWIQGVRLKSPVSKRRLSECAGHEWCSYCQKLPMFAHMPAVRPTTPPRPSSPQFGGNTGT